MDTFQVHVIHVGASWSHHAAAETEKNHQGTMYICYLYTSNGRPELESRITNQEEINIRTENCDK